jgi:hypothetical protein
MQSHIFTHSSSKIHFNINFGSTPEGKRPLGKPRHRWKDNIRMDLREIRWEVMWTGFMWLRIGTSGGLL